MRMRLESEIAAQIELDPLLRGKPTVTDGLFTAAPDATTAAAADDMGAGAMEVGSEALRVLRSTKFAALRLRGTSPCSAELER